MNRFAELLDRLAYEPGRNNKLRLMTDYFRSTPDPERGYALAALTGGLTFQHAKPDMIRALITERTDPVLFALSCDFVGDTSETIALMWPAARGAAELHSLDHRCRHEPQHARQGAASGADRALARCAGRDRSLGAAQAGDGRVARRRFGAAGQDRGRRTRRQGRHRDRIDVVRPRAALRESVRLAGRPRRQAGDAPTRRRSVPRCCRRRSRIRTSKSSIPPTFSPNGNGTASACRRQPASNERGDRIVRMYSRTGEDISKSFPDLLESLDFNGSLDGELLILRDGRVQSFNVLQQRLNRKAVTPKLIDRISRASARLRSAGRWQRGSARTAVRTAPRAPASLHRAARTSAARSVTAGAVQQLGRTRRRARRSGIRRCRRRCRRGRRRHDQAARCALCARPAERACGGNGSAIRSRSMRC